METKEKESSKYIRYFALVILSFLPAAVFLLCYFSRWSCAVASRPIKLLTEANQPYTKCGFIGCQGFSGLFPIVLLMMLFLAIIAYFGRGKLNEKIRGAAIEFAIAMLGGILVGVLAYGVSVVYNRILP